MTMNEVAERYGIASLETFQEEFTEIEFYESILNQTDHIPNKIIEAQILGEPAEDYTEILRYRQFARDEINRLEVSE